MIQSKKTKIVSTLGPASCEVADLVKLIEAGVNVFRLNFSHGDYPFFEGLIKNISEAEKQTGKSVAILQDLCGPKIRIGDFDSETVELIAGETITLVQEKIVGTVSKVYINYPTLAQEIKKGGRILLDDGKVELKVKAIKGDDVVCTIIAGGKIRGRRGVNLPGANLKTSALTAKDKKDALFGIKHGVDFVALSFVRYASDVEELRKILKRQKSDAYIISKIETEEAIGNLEEILAVSDGMMVARGDLAVEVPAERVPLIQKEIIRMCNRVGKPVITATQMLESMITAPVPTRAEVSDVANAILDGTDAIMLSAETATGAYPDEAVRVMSRVAKQMEAHYPVKAVSNLHKKGKTEEADSITGSVVNIAHDIGATLIVALTDSGFTGRMISRHKPDICVMALTPDKRTYKKLMLTYGIYPVYTNGCHSLDEAFKEVREHALEVGLAKKGDKVVVSAGAPFSVEGAKTNMLFVETL